MQRIGQAFLGLACIALVVYKIAMPFTTAWIDLALLGLSALFIVLAFAASRRTSTMRARPPSDAD